MNGNCAKNNCDSALSRRFTFQCRCNPVVEIRLHLRPMRIKVRSFNLFFHRNDFFGKPIFQSFSSYAACWMLLRICISTVTFRRNLHIVDNTNVRLKTLLNIGIAQDHRRFFSRFPNFPPQPNKFLRQNRSLHGILCGFDSIT